MACAVDKEPSELITSAVISPVSDVHYSPKQNTSMISTRTSTPTSSTITTTTNGTTALTNSDAPPTLVVKHVKTKTRKSPSTSPAPTLYSNISLSTINTSPTLSTVVTIGTSLMTTSIVDTKQKGKLFSRVAASTNHNDVVSPMSHSPTTEQISNNTVAGIVPATPLSTSCTSFLFHYN